MKKLYTLALGTALALSASAQTASLQTYQSIDKAPAEKTMQASPLAPKTTVAKKAAKALPAKFKAEAAAAGSYTVDDVVGDYDLSYYVELEGGGPYSGTLSVSSSGNDLILSFPFLNGTKTLYLDLKASFDADGTITLSSDQDSGLTGANVAFEHWTGAEYVVIKEIKAQFTGTGIVFDEDDAIGLQATSGGYYTFFDMITAVKAAAPEGILGQIVGEYNLTYEIMLQGGNDYAGTMTVKQNADGGVTFNFPFENSSNILTWKVNATVAEDGTITMSSNQASGYPGATVVFQHWVTGTGWTNLTEIKAKFQNNAIVFDADDSMGLQAASGGWYTKFATINMTKVVPDDPNADPNEGWTSVGNATFIDPWLIPGFADQYDYEYQVELQKNNENANLFRLVDPYGKGTPVGNLNESKKAHGYIQFDMTDKDHIVFEAVDAGFAMASQGISEFYCINTLTYYVLATGYEPALIVSILNDQIGYTTFKDGVILLGSFEAEDKNGNKFISYDAKFGIQGNPAAGYGWNDSDGNSADMTGSIVFPANWKDFVEMDAVSNIAVDNNAQAPVEYFNLQGQRVDNPTAGQLVIRRQGNEATKVLVK